ncbi:Ig domain-containing protein, partial [Ralstonia sp. ASV6]|uniref:Ig domain-containing protein n=1 Tax=Ralstonia sp. ASV6 TaxID=2795124 RepID=UPI0018EBC4D8
ALTTGGVLSGTPTAGGTFNFTVTATDSSAGTGSPYTGSRAYTLSVASPTLTITPASGALNGVAGTAYSRNFSASGGTSPYTYTFVVNSGSLPTGLSWNAGTATLSGTPTTAGTVNFSVTATDSSSGSGPYAVTGTYALTVSAPTIAVAPATLPSPAIATAYSQTVNASNGTAPYTYAVTAGALPTGLTLSSSGVLSGTPTAGGTFNFTVTATDANSFTASRAYSVSIGAPTVTVSPAAVTAAQVTTAYSQTFSATGGTAPYTYAVSSGTLPAGLSLNASTGVVSGTPTALGSSTFTVRATDSSTGTGAPYFGTRSYTLVVGQVIGTAPAITTTTLSNAPVTVHATANATGGPFSSIAIVSPPASGTAVINGLDIVYTPA